MFWCVKVIPQKCSVVQVHAERRWLLSSGACSDLAASFHYWWVMAREPWNWNRIQSGGTVTTSLPPILSSVQLEGEGRNARGQIPLENLRNLSLIRGAVNLKVYSCSSSLITQDIFKQLGSYERSIYPLQIGVWSPDIQKEVTEWLTKMLVEACQVQRNSEIQNNTQSLRWS